MAISNPFKKSTTPSLVNQLDQKAAEKVIEAEDKAVEAEQLAQMAAEARVASVTAEKQRIAIDRARGILLEANVTL